MPIIDADNLYSTLKEYIDEYGEEAVKANEEAIRKTAKEVTRELKKAGSFGGSSS